MSGSVGDKFNCPLPNYFEREQEVQIVDRNINLISFEVVASVIIICLG